MPLSAAMTLATSFHSKGIMNTTPFVYLAYAPRGVGVMCALFYILVGKDVYGWWIGARDGEFAPAFFMLEGFFTREDTVFYATRGSDLYGGWVFDYSAPHPELDKPVEIDREVGHQLEQMQSAFADEWLFFDGDRHVEDELAAYTRDDLVVQVVNIRNARFHKFDQTDLVWSYVSPGFDRDVLNYLMDHWPLDFGSV